jgi:hypothetical protein
MNVLQAREDATGGMTGWALAWTTPSLVDTQLTAGIIMNAVDDITNARGAWSAGILWWRT